MGHHIICFYPNQGGNNREQLSRKTDSRRGNFESPIKETFIKCAMATPPHPTPENVWGKTARCQVVP